MTREEFLAGAETLAGPERGTLRRAARLLGLKERTVYGIKQGTCPVPLRYAHAMRAALGQMDHLGRCVGLVASGCEAAVRAAERGGCSREEAAAAVVAWAGLVLAGAVPADRAFRPRR